MRQIFNTGVHILGTAGLVTSMVLTSGLSSIAQSSRTVRLDSGTVIPVELDKSLSSNNSRKGDTFTATLHTDNGDSYDGLPVGTRVEGVVRTAKAQVDKNPGVLDVEFNRMILPDGRTVPISGSLIGLDNKMVTRTSDGRIIAKPGHKNDRLTYVGYGAGAGLIVGLLTKHTLEDTAIGAGLGYLFGALDKGQHNDARDVALKSGTQMGVRLDQRVSFASYATYNDRSDRYNGSANDRYNGTSDDRYNRDGSVNDRYNSNNDRYNSDGTLNDRYRTNEQYHRTDGTTVNRGAYANDVPNSIGLVLNDRDVRFESVARPVMSNGIVMVPAIPVLRTAHVNYNWDSSRGVISTSGTEGNIRLSVGSRIAVINGSRRVRLDAPAQKLNGTIYVPAQFLALATGDDYHYDKSTRTVVLVPRDDTSGSRLR